MNPFNSAALLLCCITTQPAIAETILRPPDTAGVQLSYTEDAHTALGAELGWNLNSKWRSRLTLERSHYSRNYLMGLVNYKESYQRHSLGLYADHFLFANQGLYLSAGLLHFDKGSDWNANPEKKAAYLINGRQYAGTHLSEPSGRIEFNQLVPYLGIGWQSPQQQRNHWSVNAHAGIIFKLNPQLTIRSDNPFNLPHLQEDLQTEADKYVENVKGNNAFAKDKYFKVGLSASYRF